ncbi:MAG: hypothetical protein K1X28_10810 [Parachlamydiales bacterium]|nr:hypothetical protein [Parachlamydiales bacterium]
MSIPQMASYWEKGTFNQLYLQIKDVEKEAHSERLKAFAKFSVQDAREKLRTVVEKLRAIQKNLLAADKIADEVSRIDGLHKTVAQGDFLSFLKRIEMLKKDIQSVYKDALYPFLLAIKNAENGWDPDNFICKVCDYYSWWQVADAEAEISKTFPKN